LRVATSHTFVCPSELEARRLPSGLYATDETWPAGPSRVATARLAARSQIFTVLSWDPLASHLPSGL
jgi:hypothetical protein